jgi:hypothetical protein
MSARFDDTPAGPAAELGRRIVLRLRLAGERRYRAWSWRRLSWLLAGAFLVTLLPCQDQPVRTVAAIPSVPVSRPLLATKPAPPPADRKDTAGNATRPTPAPAAKPPPAVVEMPPPIPGPPLALAAAGAASPPARKPAPPKFETRALPAVRVSPEIFASAATPEYAPSMAASPQAPAIDSELSAEEIARIVAHREHVAQALYRPGQRIYDRDDRSIRAAANVSREMAPAGVWTALEATGSAVSTALPTAAIEVSYLARLAHPLRNAAVPTRLADLTPDEQRMILARRGVHEVRSEIHIAAEVKVAAIDYSRNPAFVPHNDMAARPTLEPLPRLPAGMAPSDGVLVATARFQIGADGSSIVDLKQGTSNPALDRLLLAALEKWSFTPAFQNGQAVASTVDVKLTISG